MPFHICTTCGTQFSERAAPPSRCPICEDSRQYVLPSGQGWTTLEAVRAKHRNAWQRMQPDLYAFSPAPDFAIAQRAFLVRTPSGNILWDCVALVDDATIDLVRGLGGLAAIAISHPHYYTTMIEWAQAFEAPVYLHAADRDWVMRPDRRVELWDGDTRALGPGLTLVRLGGHFPGATVLHWAAGSSGRGVLLAGDTLLAAPDRQHVSVMFSYPNGVPLPAAEAERIARALAPYQYEAVYCAFWNREIPSDGKGAVERSLTRYVAAVTSGLPATHPVAPD
jgi:glyoxylase-like metal-dependent hydrolase (beta-lactamase superfamily II)